MQATLRSYYPGIPSFIQASQKCLIEVTLCEVFATMMSCAWYVHLIYTMVQTTFNSSRTSASNCARLYNHAFAPLTIKEFLPANWQTKLICYPDIVWNSFFIYSLLIYHTARSEVLQIPHKAPSQADRLCPALESQNKVMTGTGQAQWNHACNKCTHVFQTEDGITRKLFSIVCMLYSIYSTYAVT